MATPTLVATSACDLRLPPVNWRGAHLLDQANAYLAEEMQKTSQSNWLEF